MMRALSLWRPWPWAFFHAGKRIENRTWPPPKGIVGEWVAMHAALRFDGDAWLRIRDGEFTPEGRDCPHNDPPRAHPTGIVGAFLVHGAFELGTTRRVGRVTAADMLSPYAFGPWCWVTPNVVELPEPIPCKGKQGLWTLPPDIEAVVRARVAA